MESGLTIDDMFVLLQSAKLNAWRQHAQAKTGGEMVTALVELARVGEIKYLQEKKA